MRRRNTPRTTITLVLVVAAMSSAITSATAGAALPEFLPGKAESTFTGKTGPSTLAFVNKGTFECPGGKNEGMLLSATEAVLTIDFEKCKAAGVSFESLGDKEGVVLIHGDMTLCYINKAKREVATVIHPTPIHLAILGKAIEVIGWTIGQIDPINRKERLFTLTFEESSVGVQKLKKCETRTEETLLATENGVAFEKASLVMQDEIDFSGIEQEVMA
ncbi:MAG TPA: hypothetical protein VN892_17285 [Solirubrobacteraceae bacterium]|nr:hypothetical protein [Solirubrobacteraceae bacterium]